MPSGLIRKGEAFSGDGSTGERLSRRRRSATFNVLACQTAFAGSSLSDHCVPDDDYVDTALALDLKTGAVKWSRRLVGYDAWTIRL